MDQTVSHSAERGNFVTWPAARAGRTLLSCPYGRSFVGLLSPVSTAHRGRAHGVRAQRHVHVVGADHAVYKSADNSIYVAGNNNIIIENCVTHGNRDTGLQLGRNASRAIGQNDWPSINLILDCESYDNYDTNNVSF